MSGKSVILKYQQDCFWNYCTDIKLPGNYTYPDGNPIRALPPVQTNVNGLMIVGAYPSARFESRVSTKPGKRYRLIPVADNLQPFGYEKYFDGVKVRELESGVGIEKYLLSEIDRKLSDCWVTDLVKVFLYKPEHGDSVGAVMPGFKVPVLRDRFSDYAEKSLPWLKRECDLCKPKLVLILGQETAQIISGDKKASADNLLNRDISYPKSIGGYPTLCLPHPDACRRYDKWRNNLKKRIKIILENI
jgi:uracil-DNA glycosylase